MDRTASVPDAGTRGVHDAHSDGWSAFAVTDGHAPGVVAESTGVGGWSVSSAARARPSAAVAIPIATAPLGDVAGAVRRQQHLAGGLAVDRERRHADRRGDAQVRSHDRLARPIRDLERAGRVRVRQQERELVAAVAEHEVRVAAGLDQLRRDLPQQCVAGLVAALVVDGPEVVEVEHDQAERRPLASAPFEPFLERPVIEQAGEVVGPGTDLDRLEDLGVLERDRDLRGEQLDELELLRREGIREPQPLDRQDADRAVTAAQRDDDQAAVDGPPSRAELVDARDRSARRR